MQACNSCFLALFALLTGLLSCREKQEADGPLLVYIMAGQSNMAGRGIIAAEDTASDPRILTIDQSMQMVPAKEPLHFYQPGFAGLDCGTAFARSLLERAPEGCRICLVPAAVGNTSLQQWLGDSLLVVHLFSNAVSRAEAAVAQGGQLAGILWHQGESDAETAARSDVYTNALDSLVSNFRRHLRSLELPFFAACLAPFCARPFKDSVNAAIERLARRRAAFVVVPTHDLSCNPDSVHFDAAGQRELGKRFAAAAAAFL